MSVGKEWFRREKDRPRSSHVSLLHQCHNKYMFVHVARTARLTVGQNGWPCSRRSWHCYNFSTMASAYVSIPPIADGSPTISWRRTACQSLERLRTIEISPLKRKDWLAATRTARPNLRII